ncbi:hypothetical protein BaRGS_00017421 [Batillaria attramentaria]|uniref:HTH CENPB-type domain-containing protein n=1 Tax=Batillaria attramentaria TaxID=370345 RepID=A0ABD0K0K2_9CAEN
MQLAYEFAERNGLQHPFNQEKKSAGKDWLRLFLRRHPEITIRQPEPTSVDRARGFNRGSVGRFFTLLEKLMDEYHPPATAIYNMDETGLSSKAPKYLEEQESTKSVSFPQRTEVCIQPLCVVPAPPDTTFRHTFCSSARG